MSNYEATRLDDEATAKAAIAASPEVTDKAALSGSQADNQAASQAASEPPKNPRDEQDARAIVGSVEDLLRFSFGDDAKLTSGQSLAMNRLFEDVLMYFGRFPRPVRWAFLGVILAAPWLLRGKKEGVFSRLRKTFKGEKND